MSCLVGELFCSRLKQYRSLNNLQNAFNLIVKGGGVQEKESIMGHRLEIGIFNPLENRAVWYLSRALVPPGPVIPRVENADLKSMPIRDRLSASENLATLARFCYSS